MTEADAVTFSKLESITNFRPVQMVVHSLPGTFIIRQDDSLGINEGDAKSRPFPIFFNPPHKNSRRTCIRQIAPQDEGGRLQAAELELDVILINAKNNRNQ